MKRLFIILEIIMLTGSVYAQSWQPSVVGYIQSYPQYMLVEQNYPSVVNVIRNSDTTNAQYQNYLRYITGDYFYSFLHNKKLFMLSYDTCSTCYNNTSKVFFDK